MKDRFDFECPDCKHTINVAMGDLKEGTVIVCDGCGGGIQVKDDSFQQAVAAMDALEAKVKKLGR